MAFWDTLGNLWDEHKLDEAQNLTKLKVNVEAAREILNEVSKITEQLRDIRDEGKELKTLTAQAWKGYSGDEMWDQIDQWMVGQSEITAKLEGFYRDGTKRLNQLVEADAALASYIRNS